MFKTQYNREPFKACSGERVRETYAGRYDNKGHLIVEPVGKIDAYAEIQSHAESVDLKHIISRYENGDVNALNRVQGFYADVTSAPTTLADVLNVAEKGRDLWYSLATVVREKFNNSYSEFLASISDGSAFEILGQKQELPAAIPVQPIDEKEVKE